VSRHVDIPRSSSLDDRSIASYNAVPTFPIAVAAAVSSPAQKTGDSHDIDHLSSIADLASEHST
jgi:hypothetical protein